jgi:hypothetical protein
MSSYTDSVSSTASLALQGVWIHDPESAAGTVRQYPYGKAARDLSVDVDQQPLYFAGRTNPVVEFGETQESVFAVRVDVPHDAVWQTTVDTLRAFSTLRKVICIRDNRGRKIFGPVSGYREKDQEWGTEVSFSVLQTDYSEETV